MKNAKSELEKQIQLARVHVLEMALVAFVEDVLGRVPSDEEILKKSFHVNFSDTPISTFARDGVRLTQFFVWDATHAVAYGFVNPQDPTALTIVRIQREQWPAAVVAFTAQWKARKEEES